MTDEARAQPIRFTRPEIMSIISGLILAMFLASLDQTIVATSLSVMAKDLQGWTLISWVVSAYLVASTVTTPIYGRLSDIYGRRPILLVSIALFVGASVLCGFSQSILQLIAARTLQGVGGGGLRSVSQAAIADVVPPRERGRYQGYFSSVMAVSNLLGPVLGGFFSVYLSWHWIFWINVPFGLLAFLLCNRNLRRLPRPRGRAIIDWFGAILIIASTTPLLLGVSRIEATGGILRPDVLAPLGCGFLLVGALVVWERAARAPMIPLRLFANSIFTFATLIATGMSMVMIALIIIVPLDYELVSHMAASDAGARLIPMTGATVAGSYISGQLVTKTGRYRIYPIGGAAAMILCCAGMAFVGLGRSLPLDILLTGGLGLAFGFQLSPVIVPAQNALDFHDTGVGLSVLMFFRLMGGAFGVALLSALLMGELNAGVSAIAGHAALGPQPGFTLLHREMAGTVKPAMLADFAEAIRHAFTRVYLCATVISVLTFLAALGLKEIPLRSS